MTVIQGRTMLEELTPDECWGLIAQQEIGRVAVLVDGFPEIYPVNHIVHDRAVLFRTAAGSKLRGVIDRPRVCFEVDGAIAADRSGWSVMLKGRAAELRTGAEVGEVADLPLRYWAQGEKDHWIRIEPLTVSGRRIRPVAERGA